MVLEEKERSQCMDDEKEWKLAGSYTVEAAVVFPILILLIAFFLRLAMAFHGRISMAAEDIQAVRELDCMAQFWKLSQIHELLEGGKVFH